jgi:hypothetical protein
VWANTVVTLTPIAIHTECLKIIGEVVLNQPRIKDVSAALSGLQFAAVFSTIIFYVVNGQEQFIGFTATGTLTTIMIQNNSTPFGAILSFPDAAIFPDFC